MTAPARRLQRRAFLGGAAGAVGALVVPLLGGCRPSTPQSAPAAGPASAGSGPTQPVAQGALTTAASGEPIRVGVLLTFAGVFAKLGEEILAGLQIALDEAGNAAGGRRLEIVREEEGPDPQSALTKTRKLIESDRVDLLVGPVSSASALAMRDLVHDARKPLLLCNSTAAALTRDRKSPYILRTVASSWQITYPMGTWVAQNVARRVFLTAADFAAGQEQMAAFKESFTAAGGTILGELYPPLGTTDYAAYLVQVQQARPEANFSFFAGSDAVNFVKQFEEFGLKNDVKLLGAGALLENDVLPAQGRAALGGRTSFYYASTLDNPQNRKFAEAFQRALGREASAFGCQGYDTGRVIVEGVNAVQGDVGDGARLVEAMTALQFNSPRGPVAFDPATRNIVQHMYVREVREVDGQLNNYVIADLGPIRDPG